MNNFKHRLGLLLVVASTLLGCQHNDSPTVKATAKDAVIKSASSDISFPCLNPPAVSYKTPGDTAITSQDGVNCFAWQTFIGLNWQVDADNAGMPDKTIPASSFGEPGTHQTSVWETYANSKNVMRSNGETPLPWGQQSPAIEACNAVMGNKADNRAIRLMHSSRADSEFYLSKDAAQAFPKNNPNWLADKNGNLVYYEILLGKDQYDYIKNNKLYNNEGQVAHLANRLNISSPLGHEDVIGGLELKSAWLKVTDPENPKWEHFKTTRAYLYDEQNNSCTENTMALVGLHVIRKTASQPQWIWATFEHVDNAPDTADIKSDGTVNGDYTFYNNSCSVMDVPAGCEAKKVNDIPVTQTSCESNISPAFKLDGTEQCAAYPIRVSRDFPIKDTDDNHVDSLNAAVQEMIKAANPDSVFANYELVNVLWSSAAVNDNEPPGNPPLRPLSISGETPALSTVPVSNTMLETYAQGFNCLSCHKDASINKDVKAQLAGKPYATDYSFVFGFSKATSK